MHDKKYSRSAGLMESGIRPARSRYPCLDCITLAERAHRRNPGTPLLVLPAYRMTRRDLRLGSGVVLFAYVTAHLANHAHSG